MIIDFQKYAGTQRAYETDVVVALSAKIGEKRALCLRRNGLETLGDLAGLHVSNLDVMYGFGEKTLNSINEALRAAGLHELDNSKADLTADIFASMLEFMTEDEAKAALESVFKPQDSPVSQPR